MPLELTNGLQNLNNFILNVYCVPKCDLFYICNIRSVVDLTLILLYSYVWYRMSYTFDISEVAYRSSTVENTECKYYM